MLKLLLRTTDKFLSNSVKTVFEKTENIYMQNNTSVDILVELKKLQNDPLGCTIGNGSKFERLVKVKIKVILGIFFVLIPLLGFTSLAYLVSFELTYSFLLTFIVAILVASRMEEITKRYVHSRSPNIIY